MLEFCEALRISTESFHDIEGLHRIPLIPASTMNRPCASISHRTRRRTGAHTRRISRFNSRRNDPGREEKRERVTEDGRRGEGGNRSRLTRWTHYHSSIWGTFSRSDQWLSIPCNGIRSDIRHRGTRARAVITGALPFLLPLVPALCTATPATFLERHTGKRVCSKRIVSNNVEGPRCYRCGGVKEKDRCGKTMGERRERGGQRSWNVAPGLNEFH